MGRGGGAARRRGESGRQAAYLELLHSRIVGSAFHDPLPCELRELLVPHVRVDRLVVEGRDDVAVLLLGPQLLVLLVGLARPEHHLLRRHLEFPNHLSLRRRLALLVQGLEEAHLRAGLQRRVVHGEKLTR